MAVPHLPLDVWTTIMEHLSLEQLAAVYNAIVSTNSNTVYITKRLALNVISTLLVTGNPTCYPYFIQNVPCYKFHLRNPEARNTNMSKIMEM